MLPERIELKKLLDSLAISRKQLIWLGMLMGTDFNDGIPKVGPKTALKIVKEHDSLKEIVRYIKEKYNAEFEVDPVEIEQTFESPTPRRSGRRRWKGFSRRRSPTGSRWSSSCAASTTSPRRG